MDIETSEPAIDTKKERQNINMPEAEMQELLPKTAKLGYATLQKNRILNVLENIREKAIADFLTISGLKGSLIVALKNGPKISVTAGIANYTVAQPGCENEVSKAYSRPQEILEEALKAGAAEKKEKKDFNIVISRPEKQEKETDNSILEKLIASCPNQHIELESETLKEKYPKLKSAIYCQVQNKRLELGIKRMMPEAKSELEQYPNTNINTSLNGQDLRISTFSKSNIKILPGFPEWEKKLKAAQKETAKKLAQLEAEGKAKKAQTFYLTVAVQPKEKK